MVRHGLRITVCVILLVGVASAAAAQQDDLPAANESYRAPSLIDALDIYADARNAFDRKEYAVAVVQFERTLALLDDAAATLRSTGGESAAADLALLTTGFLDLSRVLAGRPEPEPARTRPGVGAGDSRFVRKGSRLDPGVSG